MSDNNEFKKKLLIITGPQGSGNHLFSKIFSFHGDVQGWDFKENYWIPSDEEPFADCWVTPSKTRELLRNTTKNYVVANVSVPFVYDGQKTIPAIQEVHDVALDDGWDVQIGIVARDQNINKMQQQRVRGEHTLPTAMQYYYCLNAKVNFLSHESLYLYRGYYLSWLSRVLEFPIAHFDRRVEFTLEQDQNKKYVKYVGDHWLDEHVWKGIRPKNERLD
jgi:hypothetical protein